MSNESIGMSGSSFDAFVSSQRTHNDTDWAAKIHEKYWRARQKFLAKIEKNEDSCIVLSDSKLDAKLEIYRSIDSSCARLTNIFENYQNSLFMFANEENALGILLKECGKQDKTKAGKIMSITGRSLTQSSHQRIRLYMPLLRLFQEMETFHTRAVEDTTDTVDKLESSRTQYRASLLWMKDISEKLNPDVYKQLDKFRRVQNKVRDDKRAFDGMQMDVVQKIDLLMASRCNLMNQILAPYQTILLETFEKNFNNFKSVDELIRNEDIYEYEFKTLKQLNPLKISDDHPKDEMAETAIDENLLGDIGQESTVTNDGNNNCNARTLSEDFPGDLIDVSEGGGGPPPVEKLIAESGGDTLDLLDSLFGNNKAETSTTGEGSGEKPSEEVSEKKLMQPDDLKLLMSNLDVNLFHVDDDEEKQIASLLGPSEKLRRRNTQRVEHEPTPLTDDDDIFARWARDADIDLLSDLKQEACSSSHIEASSVDKDHKGQDKNVDLMDIEPLRDETGKSRSRFYA